MQLILDGEVDLVVNTPHGSSGSGGSVRVDGYEIRTAAVLRQHPVHHHRAGARRRGAGHRGAAIRGDIGVRSLQDWAAPVSVGRDGVRRRCSTACSPGSTPSGRTTLGLPGDPRRRGRSLAPAVVDAARGAGARRWG